MSTPHRADAQTPPVYPHHRADSPVPSLNKRRPSVPIAQLNGININYQFDGDGDTTIVLINGLADELESWDFQVPALVEAGLRVLRFDNRGIGKSDAPEGPYTSRQLADDAKALVDHLGITNYHVMGVSMGGMIAQEYALAYGSDIRSLT